MKAHRLLGATKCAPRTPSPSVLLQRRSVTAVGSSGRIRGEQARTSSASLFSSLFQRFLGSKSASQATQPEEQQQMFRQTPRRYQQELVDLVQHTNALITLPTGVLVVQAA